MQSFFASVLIKVLTDPEVQAWLKKEGAELFNDVIAKSVIPVIPVAIGSAVKAAMDELIEKVPGISGVVDVVKTTEAAASGLGELVGQIPILGDILKNFGFGA
jgi:hypothetical protein